MSDVYNTRNLQTYWLFYGEYHSGSITLHPKTFAFYVNAINYNPEQLLFQVHRTFLNTQMSDGRKIEVSPESLMGNPDDWIFRAIPAMFCQYQWEKTRRNIFLSDCSTMHAIEKHYESDRLVFAKCGVEFYKIQRRSLKVLAKYPEAVDLQ